MPKWIEALDGTYINLDLARKIVPAKYGECRDHRASAYLAYIEEESFRFEVVCSLSYYLSQHVVPATPGFSLVTVLPTRDDGNDEARPERLFVEQWPIIAWRVQGELTDRADPVVFDGQVFEYDSNLDWAVVNLDGTVNDGDLGRYDSIADFCARRLRFKQASWDRQHISLPPEGGDRSKE